MKAFIHDDKHGAVVGQLDLGPITMADVALLEKVSKWLDDQGITNRYKRLVIAESYEIVYDKEDGFSSVEFQ